MKNWILRGLIGVLAIVLLVAAYWKVDIAGEVNVYSHRHYEIDATLFEDFTRETGIKVNVVKGNADELIKRLELEGDQSPADLLITVDAGRLHRAKEKNLLQPIQSELVKQRVPSHLRDPEGYWFGLTQRARVIVYSKERVDPAKLSTYEALIEPEWKGRILVRSSSNIYNQSLLASMIATRGKEEALKWARGIVTNMARTPRGSDRDQIKAIASGVGDIALVNTYYLGLMLTSADPQEREAASKVAIFFPNQGDRGAHVNVSGAGVTRSAKNVENAVHLLEFLVDEDAQGLFARANSEYPVNPAVEPSELLQSWGDFKADTLNLPLLGEHNLDAVQIFDQAGWR
ncbi:MAG TPA: Fe(3+) ABC transporter substrate-binding protein [Acidobacteriota bacterium]|nr:Fe(3+) ABC transporter substrate-binding protein [Acidobacteriota bacterium]